MLDPGKRGQEEWCLIRLLWRLFWFVALLYDFEVEECLPAGAGEKGECDKFAVELRRGREDVRRLVLDCECGERV